MGAIILCSTNGLGYIAEESSKSESFGCLWWLLIPIVLMIMGLVYIAYQDNKKEELEEVINRDGGISKGSVNQY
jgi:hypothetical protein